MCAERGRRDWALSAGERADARAALQVLEGSGISLEAAARLALRLGPEGGLERVTVQVAADRFLRHCLDRVTRGELREATYSFYEQGLTGFLRAFAGRTVADIEAAALRRYFDVLPGSTGTVRARRRAVGVFLRWCARQSPPLAREHSLSGLDQLPPRQTAEISVLPPEAVEGAMHAAGRYAAALALVFFGGLRIGEVRGTGKPALTWGQINLGERIIRVPAECAKTRRARVLERLPENLWPWLESSPGAPDAPICPARPRQAIAAAKAGLPDGTAWEKNVHRHCFASYHLAHWNDPGRLSILLGHEGSTAMLYRHYRGLVTRNEAARYFEIRPAQP